MTHRELRPEAECRGDLIASGRAVTKGPDGLVRATDFYRCDHCHAIITGDAPDIVDVHRLIRELAARMRLPKR